MNDTQDSLTKVAAHRRGVCHIMDALQIPCFFAEGRYSVFRDDVGEYILNDGIAALEQRFAKCGFVRANRKTLVNSAFIKELRRDGRFLELKLGENLVVRVSKRQVPKFNRYLAATKCRVRGTKKVSTG